MTSREFFIETVKDELPRFERLFKALPEDKLDYRPHPTNSRSAKELVGTMSAESGTFVEFMSTGEVDMGKTEAAKTFSGLSQSADNFTENMNATVKQAVKMSEEEWEMEAAMLHNGKAVWKTKRGSMAWSLLLDLIHHRGQLSVYIRPMGGKVPSIYGPSADSKE